MIRPGPRALLRSLEAIAREAQTKVRYETIARPRGVRAEDSIARGGLCTVRGETMIVCDATLPTIDKVVVIAEALDALGVQLLALPPILRARLRTKLERASLSGRSAGASASLRG